LLGDTPALELKDLQRTPRTLADYRGKVLILNFWATWCEPCIEEMPSLQKLRERLSGKINVVGVNLGEGDTRIEKFMAKTGATFPVLLDRDGDAKIAWRVMSRRRRLCWTQWQGAFLLCRASRFRRSAIEAKIKH